MDLSTNYLGLKLNSPVVVSACPLSHDVDNIAQMEEMGAGAVVLFSLFEEQVRRESELYEALWDDQAAAQHRVKDFAPRLEEYRVSSDYYLELIRAAKERVNIPIIASLNGVTDAGWIQYAQLMEEAGADALELNVFYVPADLELDGKTVEGKYLDILKGVKQQVDIPVAIKLNPFFSAMGHMAKTLEGAGADGLVLFNRFFQPDFNIYELKLNLSLEFSDASEIRLPLLWLSILSGRMKASMAATSGVQGSSEIVKYLLAGADVVMTASALYKYGVGYLETMHDDLRTWMRRMGFDTVADFRGKLRQETLKDLSAFQRANYIRILEGI